MGRGKLVQVGKDFHFTASQIALDSDKEIGQVIEDACLHDKRFKDELERVRQNGKFKIKKV